VSEAQALSEEVSHGEEKEETVVASEAQGQDLQVRLPQALREVPEAAERPAWCRA